jgi:hypothetical protein
VEFAWTEIVSEAPIMANPGEYRTLMYEVFWHGNTPAQRESSDGKAGSAHLTPQQAQDDLKALVKQAERLRAEQQSS